jgi:hypothetical protein
MTEMLRSKTYDLVDGVRLFEQYATLSPPYSPRERPLRKEGSGSLPHM